MKNAEKLSCCICLNMPENKERNVVIQRLFQLGEKKSVADAQVTCGSYMSFHFIFIISCMCNSLQFLRFTPVSQSCEQADEAHQVNTFLLCTHVF